MAYATTIVPAVTGGMTTEYFTEFINTTVGTVTLIQILDSGSKLVLVWEVGV